MDWDQVIRHSERMQGIIRTQKQFSGTNNWIAYLTDNRQLWANGEGESDAIGNLFRTYTEAIIERVTAPYIAKLAEIHTLAENILAEDDAIRQDFGDTLDEIRNIAYVKKEKG